MLVESEELIKAIRGHDEVTHTGNSNLDRVYSLAHKHIIELIQAEALLAEAKAPALHCQAPEAKPVDWNKEASHDR